MTIVKYLSLFSGIGGFEQALETSATGIDFQCVGYSEIDPHAIEVYDSHFEHNNLGDITKVVAEDVPAFDLLVGGFPCQAFSVAGKQQGFADTRGTLFFDIARVLEYHKPTHFILENVKGLLNHDNGNTISTILTTLDELGYCVEWQVLNSKNFNLPQSRDRIYLVGHLGGIPERRVFPFTQAADLNLREVTQGVGDAFRIYKPQLARTLKALGGGLGALTGLYQMDDLRVRKLTPVEAERCQGFPDNWTFGTPIQRYRRCGNAVSVPVVRAIVNRMYGVEKEADK